MNCQAMDEDIRLTFEHYGPIGVDVQLYGATDTASPNPPFDWIDVTVVVTPVVLHPTPSTDTWYYGGLLHHTSHPGRPLGVLPIDRNRLVGACSALAAIGGSVPEKGTSCTLSWPLVPSLNEPVYAFSWAEGSEQLRALVGAYSGKVLNRHPANAAAAA